MFMEPEFDLTTGYVVETSEGAFYLPHSVCGIVQDTADLQDYVPGDIDHDSVLPIEGTFWRLSAPGYLDCTEWSFAETLEEAIADCYQMFGDDDPKMVETLASELPGFDEFWKGYLFGLAFTATGEGNPEGTFDDDHPETVEAWSNPGGDIRDVVDTGDVEQILRDIDEYDSLRADCLSFYLDALPLFGEGADLESAGSDFHLTRNGHGAGFWDGDWKEGERLTELSKPYGSAELMFRLGDIDNPEGDYLDVHDSYDWTITH